MLKYEDDWIEKYPGLSMFNGMNGSEIYENTMLFSPMELLKSLSEGNLTEEQMEYDMNLILSNVKLTDSLMTSFEFALYQLLRQKFVKKCYIYKENSFFDNEILYLSEKYEDVIGKIELESGCPIDQLYDKIDATTIYTRDMGFIFDYVQNNVKEEKKSGQVFILLNTCQNMTYFEEVNSFFYDEEFYEKVKSSNAENPYTIYPTYNFQIDDDEQKKGDPLFAFSMDDEEN